MGSPLLEVDEIAVHFQGRSRLLRSAPPSVKAVNDVSLTVEAGRTYGLIGESGSGKSTAARAVLRLVPVNAGTIRVNGRDVARVKRHEHLDFCRQVQAVLQEPFTSLSAFHSAEGTIGDVLTRHFGMKGSERRARVLELLDAVGLGAEFADRLPHEMSAGQCQRVSLARALAVDPRLIIFDEATSALDVAVRSQVVNLLSDLQDRTGMGYLFISHDLETVRHLADEVGVMYLGYLLETGAPEAIYHAPAHPYGEILAASIPKPSPILQRTQRRHRRDVVANVTPPSPTDLPAGCPLVGRCAAAMEICHVEMPAPTPAHHGGTTRCHLHTSGPCLGGESVVGFMRKAREVEVLSRRALSPELRRSYQETLQSVGSTVAPLGNAHDC